MGKPGAGHHRGWFPPSCPLPCLAAARPPPEQNGSWGADGCRVYLIWPEDHRLLCTRSQQGSTGAALPIPQLLRPASARRGKGGPCGAKFGLCLSGSEGSPCAAAEAAALLPCSCVGLGPASRPKGPSGGDRAQQRAARQSHGVRLARASRGTSLGSSALCCLGVARDWAPAAFGTARACCMPPLGS